MKSKILILLLAFAMVAAFAFAGGGGEPPTPGEEPVAAPKEYQITWSSVSVPGDAHTKAMLVFKLELEHITDGQIEVEVYHSGQLFGQNEAKAALRRGTLDMDYMGPTWIAQWEPKWSMFAMPYVFKSYEHMSKFFNSEAEQKPHWHNISQY